MKIKNTVKRRKNTSLDEDKAFGACGISAFESSIQEEITISDDDNYIDNSPADSDDEDVVFVENQFTSREREQVKELDCVPAVKFTTSTYTSFPCLDRDLSLIILDTKNHFPCSSRLQCKVLHGRCQVNDFIMTPAEHWIFIDAYTLGDYPTIIKNAHEEGLDENGLDLFYKSLKRHCSSDVIKSIKSLFVCNFCCFFVRNIPTTLELRFCSTVYGDLRLKRAGNFNTARKIANKEKGDSYTKEFIKALHQASNRLDDGENFVLIVTGPNNIGKSTFVRRFLNRALSSNFNAYHLETDCGQTEFTLPGCLALTQVVEPVFGDPFTHLRGPEKCYFFGDIQPSSRLEHYLKLVTDLKEHFDHLTSGRKAVLVVNTNGWISGHGLQTLLQMITNIRPDRVVCLASEVTDSNSFNRILHETFRNTGIAISRVSSILDFHSVGPKKNSRFLRDLNITAYFSRLFAESHDLDSPICLRSIAPYKIDINSLKINVLHGVAPPKFILSIINANLVALCHSSEPSQDRWSDDEKSPFLVNDEHHPECLGFGIVRAIDIGNNAIYILSPLSPEKLRLVNVILKGAIDIPLALIAKFNSGLNDCPYYIPSRERLDRNDASIADYLNESIRNRSSYMKKKVRAS